MFDDVDRLMKPWGSAGKFDPLDDVYKVRNLVNYREQQLSSFIIFRSSSSSQSGRVGAAR